MKSLLFERLALIVSFGILVLAPGCTTLGLDHENDDGIKGRVVDSATGRPIPGAKLTGYSPSYDGKDFKTKADGSYCFHYRRNPGAVVVLCQGYETVTIPLSKFAQMERIELRPDPRPRKQSRRGELDDPYTDFERGLIDGLKKQ